MQTYGLVSGSDRQPLRLDDFHVLPRRLTPPPSASLSMSCNCSDNLLTYFAVGGTSSSALKTGIGIYEIMLNYTQEEETHRDQVPVISFTEMNRTVTFVRGVRNNGHGQHEHGVYLVGAKTNSDSTND